jgi:YesN/AraC family two-component response regulator
MMTDPKLAVLLVDDAPHVLRALERLIPADEFIVFTAGSAQQALRTLETESIDVIITDEKMPGASGTDLLKTVRTLLPEVTRIMLTGLTGIEVARKAINTGEIFRFFNKPWDDFELLTALRQVAQMKRIERENKRLRTMVARQEDLLAALEREHPGITITKKGRDGALILDI